MLGVESSAAARVASRASTCNDTNPMFEAQIMACEDFDYSNRQSMAIGAVSTGAAVAAVAALAAFAVQFLVGWSVAFRFKEGLPGLIWSGNGKLAVLFILLTL